MSTAIKGATDLEIGDRIVRDEYGNTYDPPLTILGLSYGFPSTLTIVKIDRPVFARAEIWLHDNDTVTVEG